MKTTTVDYEICPTHHIHTELGLNYLFGNIIIRSRCECYVLLKSCIHVWVLTRSQPRKKKMNKSVRNTLVICVVSNI